MNGADSEPRRQLPTTAAREMTASQPKWRQLCVEYGGLLEIVFLRSKLLLQVISLWLIFTLRIDVYALRDLMGHCYVHFAFLFTLMYVM